MLPTIGGLLSYFYSQNQEPIYQAHASILVQYRGGGTSLGVSDFTRSRELASTYARQVSARPFLERVEQSGQVPFNADRLRTMISSNTEATPPAVEVIVKHSDPGLAAATAQVLAEQFINYAVEQRLAEIARLQTAAAAQGLTNVESLVSAQFTAVDSLSLLEPVRPPGRPTVPRTRQNITLGVILGLVLATGGALLLEGLGDTVRFHDQLNRRFGVNGLGIIFRWSSQDVEEDSPVVWKSPASSYAEAFRQIRANLQFATANQPGNVFMVTSPGPGEGKTTILSNLAVSLAHTGKRIAVIDGDLRRPSLHRQFDVARREPGLSNLLADQTAKLDDAMLPTEVEGITILPSGPTPPNPGELLGSSRMAALMSELRDKYDMVLVDSPPMLMVADTAVLSTQVDGAIVVVDGTSTRSSSLQAALETLRNTKVSIFGVIINKLKRSRFGYGYSYPYYYYYYSFYSYYSDENGNGAGADGRFYTRLGRRAKTALSRLRRR